MRSIAGTTLAATRAVSVHPRPRIGINLCFIRGDWATGLTVYVRQLLGQLLEERAYDWIIYCHEQLTLPAAWEDLATVRRCISTHRRPLRVAFEEFVLPWLLRRDHIDLVFSPAFVSPAWGARWRIATIHDMYYKTHPESMTPMQRIYRKAFTPLTARHCHRVLTVSQYTANEIARFLPRVKHKVRVTPLACAIEDPTAPGEPVPDLEPGYILFVANVIASKNSEAVAAAAAALAAKGTPKRFVHVGKDEEGLLAAALARHGCVSSFRRMGRVPAAQLRWLYQNAVCAVQPSFCEGFGLPVLEAQTFGTPLISSDAGALPEVAGDGALFFSPHDSGRLTQLISELERNDALRQVLIKRGHANTARFAWSTTARATLDAFSELLAEHKQPLPSPHVGRGDGSTSSSHADSV